MQELIDCLERCVRQSVFVSDRLGGTGWKEYRELFRHRGSDEFSWIRAAAARLETDEGCVRDLAAQLEPVVAGYQHPGTGQVGNGLYLLLGGPGGPVHPSVTEFARILITGAVKIGSERVVGLLREWVGGEPLHYRINVLLQGAEIDGPLRVPEGIGLWKLPESSGDLPASLPFSLLTDRVSVLGVMGGVVLSFDCGLNPALYRPEDREVSRSLPRNGNVTLGSDRAFSFPVSHFCESLSLACNGFVDWFLQWQDLGDLEAFAGRRTWDSFRYPRHAPTTKVAQADLALALEIQDTRDSRARRGEGLELALRRWVGSKGSETDSDRLIELRIALEALYDIGESNERGFRIATYGAWHLGEDVERRKKIWGTLDKAYRDASSAAHGGRPEYAAQDPALIGSAQDICRLGILKRLGDAESPEWNEEILGRAD